MGLPPKPTLNLGLCPECGHRNQPALGEIICAECGLFFMSSGPNKVRYYSSPKIFLILASAVGVALALLVIFADQ